MTQEAEVRRSDPVLVAATVAVVSTGALAAAVAGGWLGPDVGAGGQFCEAAHDVVRQPVNTLSNLGFVAAGLAVAVRARRGRLGSGPIGRWPSLATAYAVLVVLLGPGSMAMHATGTRVGGELDVLSMFLVSSFALAYATRRRPAVMAAVFAVALVVQGATRLTTTEVPVVHVLSNLAFGVTLLLAIALESRRRARRETRWLWGAVGSLAVAFAIWNTAMTGSGLCLPHSLYQGHGVWHLLCALSAYCLFRLYASEQEPGLSSPPGPGRPSRAGAARA